MRILCAELDMGADQKTDLAEGLIGCVASLYACSSSCEFHSQFVGARKFPALAANFRDAQLLRRPSIAPAVCLGNTICVAPTVSVRGGGKGGGRCAARNELGIRASGGQRAIGPLHSHNAHAGLGWCGAGEAVSASYPP